VRRMIRRSPARATACAASCCSASVSSETHADRARPAPSSRRQRRAAGHRPGGAANWDLTSRSAWATRGRTTGAPAAAGGQGTRAHAHVRRHELIGDAVGYKLVSDDGAYHLYTYEQGQAGIHSSSEAGRLFYYDAPGSVAWPTCARASARRDAADAARRGRRPSSGWRRSTCRSAASPRR